MISEWEVRAVTSAFFTRSTQHQATGREKEPTNRLKLSASYERGHAKEEKRICTGRIVVNNKMQEKASQLGEDEDELSIGTTYR
jgi:hypothetical protein